MFDKQTTNALMKRANDPRALSGTIVKVGDQTKLVFPTVGDHSRLEIEVQAAKPVKRPAKEAPSDGGAER